MIQHKDKTYETVLEQALDIAGALYTKRRQGPWRTLENIDEDEERADLALHIVDRMRYYKADKGAVSTFIYKVFSQWAWETVQARAARWESERLYPPIRDDDQPTLTVWDVAGNQIEDAPTPAPFSERAEELIAHFPEGLRGSIRLVWGDGLNSMQAAGLLGISDNTVRRHIHRARQHIPQIAAALEAA